MEQGRAARPAPRQMDLAFDREHEALTQHSVETPAQGSPEALTSVALAPLVEPAGLVELAELIELEAPVEALFEFEA